MSSRSWNTEALVLSVLPFSDDHRTVMLLIPEEHGAVIQPATLFGGARSKLKGMVIPYQTGRIWLYSNPVKNSHKITDFSVNSYRMELGESLVRSWCAAVCSEITLKTCGTVDWQLVNAFLDGLCVSDDAGCERGLLRFLWRLIWTAGIAPDIFHCSICGCSLSKGDRSIDADESRAVQGGGAGGTHASQRVAAAVYSSTEDACFCSTCRRADAYTFPLSAEAIGYLYAVTERPPGYSRHLPLSPAAYGELKRFLFFLTEKMIGNRLKTFQVGYI